MKRKLFDLLYKIDRAMVDHPSLRWIYTLAKKLGIVDTLLKMVNDNISRAEEWRAAFKQMYEQHKDDIRRVSEMLEDDFSRYTLEKLVECHLTQDMDAVKDIQTPHQYFQKDIISPVKDEVFVDGGAYTGDTIKEFLKFCGGGVTKRSMPGSLTPILV